MRYTIEYLKEQTFGKLKVVAEADAHVFPSGAKHRQMLCKCSCGSETTINLYNLLSGNTEGCARCAVNAPTHRLSTLPEYRIYKAMISRCHDAADKGYANYGGRGIVVEEPIKSSFEEFLKEVGRRPDKDYTLDRIDVQGNYCVGNIRWVLWADQQHNKRKRKGSTSNYIGVCKVKRGWRAQLQKEGEKLLDMVLSDEYSAALAYDNASEEIYGDRPNKTSKN